MGSPALSHLQASAARVIDLSSSKHEDHDADRLPNGGPATNRTTTEVNSEANDGSSVHQRPGSNAES